MGKFLRKCLQLLKYGALIIAGSLYIWALIFLLKSDNWVGISALTTMLLAIAAFWTIWDRREQEKRDRKERLLNEIIEWASEIIEWNIDASYEAKKELRESQKPFMVILMQLFRLSEGFRKMKRKGKLTIYPFIITLNSKPLTDAIDTLLKYLQTQIELGGSHEMAIMEDIIAKTQTLSNNFSLAETQVINHKKLLDETAEKVIKEATKIKTKDIRIGEFQEVTSMADFDVGKQLVEIKKLLTKNERRVNIQWVYSIGFAGMISSVALLDRNIGAAIVVFILGLGMMVLAPYIRR